MNPNSHHEEKAEGRSCSAWLRVGIAVAIIGPCLTFSGCAGGKSEPVATEQVDSTPTVPVAKVTRANLSGQLTLTAEFEPYQEIDIMAKVAGYVRSIKVDIGDRVTEGQVLATLEVPEMEDELAKAKAAVSQADAEVVTASNEIERAKAAHELAHLSLTRIEGVVKREKGLVPQQQVDEFRSKDLSTEAQVAGVKSALVVAQERARVARAEVARLQTMYKYTTITAPFTGVVTKRYANSGAMIQAGTASQSQAMPVVRLSQNNLLRLSLPVPESAAARVHIGQRVDVRVPSLNRTFAGRVARFAGKLQISTRTMDTEVDVPNPALALLPGMYAEVDLQIDERPNALCVPLDGVERSGNSVSAYVVQPSGTIQITPVSLGLETPQRVEVRSGLEEGDMVIVGRHAGLKKGDRVQPKLIETAVEPDAKKKEK
jgi:RND family efflux transporter MFP subunit